MKCTFIDNILLHSEICFTFHYLVKKKVMIWQSSVRKEISTFISIPNKGIFKSEQTNLNEIFNLFLFITMGQFNRHRNWP